MFAGESYHRPQRVSTTLRQCQSPLEMSHSETRLCHTDHQTDRGGRELIEGRRPALDVQSRQYFWQPKTNHSLLAPFAHLTPAKLTDYDERPNLRRSSPDCPLQQLRLFRTKTALNNQVTSAIIKGPAIGADSRLRWETMRSPAVRRHCYSAWSSSST